MSYTDLLHAIACDGFDQLFSPLHFTVATSPRGRRTLSFRAGADYSVMLDFYSEFHRSRIRAAIEWITKRRAAAQDAVAKRFRSQGWNAFRETHSYHMREVRTSRSGGTVWTGYIRFDALCREFYATHGGAARKAKQAGRFCSASVFDRTQREAVAV